MAAAPLSWVAQVAVAAVFLASDETAAITGILVSVASGDAPARRGG
jgi:enoyl-[acyl-carrier-protein] reductase (NADH)